VESSEDETSVERAGGTQRVIVDITVGILLLVVTTAVHAAAMSILLWRLRVRHAAMWGRRSYLTRLVVVSFAVVCLLYFSMVTFTSLGYGDVVLPPSGWRLLASFEAANGILMFGWTTALIFFVVQHLYLCTLRMTSSRHRLVNVLHGRCLLVGHVLGQS
jgi:hypothetical protein